MVEMFCKHTPEGEPYAHEDHDHDEDAPPADGARRLDGHEDHAEGMEHEEHAEMSPEEMEAANLIRMNRLHKLMDAGEEAAGVENHWLCHQALHIYDEIIGSLH